MSSSVADLHSPLPGDSANDNDGVALALLEMTRQARGTQSKVESFRLLRQLAVALRRLFSPFCEVVIHDFTDFEHSIVCIEGNITNRRVGGSATDLLLAKASQGDTDEDLYNYLTSLPGGRLMKSCTVFLREESGAAYGAFCVNFEITAFVSMHKVMANFVATEERGDVVETFANDIEDTIHAIVADTLYETGQTLSLMGRDEKVELIARLADKGVFQVKKSVSILADQLGLSRATIYNYLRDARLTTTPSQALPGHSLDD
jgi:predicted transcriptional regulator YheO